MFESVVPASERPLPMVSELIAPVPLPRRSPVSVVEPVPPLVTPSVPPKDESERQFPPTAKQPVVRFTPVAKVEVALVSVVVAVPFDIERSVVDAPALNCWSAVQVLALPKLRATVTAPTLGVTVRVPLAAVTDETPPTQVFPIAKHPAEILIPEANVEVAVEEELKYVPDPRVKFPTKVEEPLAIKLARVAVPDAVNVPAVFRDPETNTEFLKVEEASASTP